MNNIKYGSQQHRANLNRLNALALQGWQQFFHYLFRGKFKIAWMELKMSKENVKYELERQKKLASKE